MHLMMLLKPGQPVSGDMPMHFGKSIKLKAGSNTCLCAKKCFTKAVFSVITSKLYTKHML